MSAYKIVMDHQYESQPAWQVLETSPWLTVQEDGFIPDFPPHAALIVPLELWRLRRGELIQRPGLLGVLLTQRDDPAEIAGDRDGFAVIAVEFDPGAPDGRLELAHALRAYGFHGELWAVKSIERTGIAELARFDFDALLLRTEEHHALVPIDVMKARGTPQHRIKPPSGLRVPLISAAQPGGLLHGYR